MVEVLTGVVGVAEVASAGRLSGPGTRPEIVEAAPSAEPRVASGRGAGHPSGGFGGAAGAAGRLPRLPRPT